MSQSDNSKEELAYQQRLEMIRGLRAQVFQNIGSTVSTELLLRLAQEEASLRQMQPEKDQALQSSTPARAPLIGNLLGAATTQLEVEIDLRMHPLPTGIYHLLNPAEESLIQLTVKNTSRDPRRVLLKAGIQGLSAEAAKTVELGAKSSKSATATVSLLPTLLPGVLQAMTEVQQATLYVISIDLDKKMEAYDTYPIVCLSRNSSFNAVRNPKTGSWVDLSRYYGAWVTPYDEKVQEVIRAAADLCATSQIWGYQGKESDVPGQVKALFEALKKHGIRYVNSVIDYGAPEVYATQRTRLPRESLQSKSANCIDGTVLMASLLEGASLNPAIVLVPGHAFVGWETWYGSEKFEFLETTMVGESPFEEAFNVGRQQFEIYLEKDLRLVKLYSLRELRREGIWPIS
jgi:hypothetical protein